MRELQISQNRRSRRPPLPLEEMVRRHEVSQQGPLPAPHITRPVPRGRKVAVFFLSLRLCEPQDRRRKAPMWVYASKRKGILSWLEPQWLAQPRPALSLPLPVNARPQVLCVRYSSVEPDAFADWAKQAIDCLQPGGTRKGKPFAGLGIIKSDRPSECDVRCWWEPARVGQGFVAIEVWTG